MTIIYKTDSGELIMASEHPMPDNVLEVALAGGNKSAIDGFCEIDDCYVEDGILRNKPPKPSDDYVFNYLTKQWELSEILATQSALAKRQMLLIQSDWTQLPDVPLSDKEAWAVYRQELRDITSQPDFPNVIIWPTPPTEGA